MCLYLNWCCGHCSKVEKLKVTGEQIKDKDAYDMPLPTGWVWKKYKSINYPDKDSRALGCSEEHAKLAAARFEIPEWA